MTQSKCDILKAHNVWVLLLIHAVHVNQITARPNPLAPVLVSYYEDKIMFPDEAQAALILSVPDSNSYYGYQKEEEPPKPEVEEQRNFDLLKAFFEAPSNDLDEVASIKPPEDDTDVLHFRRNSDNFLDKKYNGMGFIRKCGSSRIGFRHRFSITNKNVFIKCPTTKHK